MIFQYFRPYIVRICWLIPSEGSSWESFQVAGTSFDRIHTSFYFPLPLRPTFLQPTKLANSVLKQKGSSRFCLCTGRSMHALVCTWAPNRILRFSVPRADQPSPLSVPVSLASGTKASPSFSQPRPNYSYFYSTFQFSTFLLSWLQHT